MSADRGACGSPRRRALLLAPLLVATRRVRAQTGHPQLALKLILTAPPGSSIDVLGRLIAERLRERFGYIVVAENRPAAGGTVGTDAVAKGATDGSILGLSFTGPLVLAPLLYRSLPYDPARDLAPVVLVGTAPNILAINARLPVRSLDEFIAWVRARPGQLNYASVGNGSTSHLAFELLKAQAALYMIHIPYNGSPPAVQAVAAGDVDAIVSNPTSLLPLIQSGRVRALATTGVKRWSGLPDVPTVAERGFPGFEAVAWNGIVAPAALPAELLDRCNREINAILAEPATRARIAGAGWDPVGGSAAQFAAFIQTERVRWAAAVKRSGARLD